MKHFVIAVSLFLFPAMVYTQCNYGYGEWNTSHSKMAVGRSSFSTVTYNDSIYVIGGFSNLDPIEYAGSVDIYIPATDTWEIGISEFPFPRACPNSCLVGSKIYMCGGARIIDGNPVMFDSLHIYDIPTNSWSTGAPLPAGKSYHGADTINGKIFMAAGGTNGWTVLKTLYVYDPELDEWAVKSPLNSARWGPGTQSWNGKLYVFGGYDVNFNHSRSIEVYDPELDQWNYLSLAPTPRVTGEISLIENQLFVFGGFHGYSSPLYQYTKIISRYDLQTDTWFNFPHKEDRIPGGRRYLSSSVIDGTTYIFGGGENQLSPDVWSYKLKEIRQDMEIRDTILASESIEIDLSNYFSSTNEEALIYSVCPGYNEELIQPFIENSILRIDRLAQAGSTEIAVNVSNTQDTISSNTFSVQNPVGIQTYGNHKLSIYPNPASEIVTFTFDGYESSQNMLEIYNTSGRLIERIQLENMTSGIHQYEWNVQWISNGLYFVMLKNRNSTTVGKLMINH